MYRGNVKPRFPNNQQELISRAQLCNSSLQSAGTWYVRALNASGTVKQNKVFRINYMERNLKFRNFFQK
jgi:hypothetical protein